MNLVAKEYSILTEPTAGVLVLSDRTGAAAELGANSILVDGAKPESIADGLLPATSRSPRDGPRPGLRTTENPCKTAGSRSCSPPATDQLSAGLPTHILRGPPSSHVETKIVSPKTFAPPPPAPAGGRMSSGTACQTRPSAEILTPPSE